VEVSVVGRVEMLVETAPSLPEPDAERPSTMEKRDGVLDSLLDYRRQLVTVKSYVPQQSMIHVAKLPVRCGSGWLTTMMRIDARNRPMTGRRTAAVATRPITSPGPFGRPKPSAQCNQIRRTSLGNAAYHRRHLLFSIATTGYILIAIQLEERDPISLFSDQYRRYRQQVSMFFPIPRRVTRGRHSAQAISVPRSH
jgi:hypothetical protein